MDLLNKKIDIAYKKNNKSKVIINAHSLSYYYYLKYKYYDNYKSLNDSIHVLKETVKNDVYEEKIFLSLSFLYVENKDYEVAISYLKKFESYKKYYQNNEINNYTYFLYVKYTVLKYGRKIFQKRFTLIKLIKLSRSNTLAQMLLGKIYLEDGNYEEAYEYLTLAYLNGNRSTYLFQSLYDYYANSDNSNDASELIFKVCMWAIRKGLNINKIFNESGVLKSTNINNNTNLKIAKKIYEQCENEYLLKQIVINMSNKKEIDTSEKAFDLYKQCENKQVQIEGLETAIVKCSIKYNYENISKYTISKYIEKHSIISEEKAYIFNLILNYNKFEDYLERYKSEIINFYKLALLQNRNNIIFYNGYKYLLLNKYKSKLDKNNIARLEEILLNNLFCYEIITDYEKNATLYVNDKYLGEYVTAKFNNKVCTINIINDNFEYFLFDEKDQKAINSKLQINKCLKGNNLSLINYFIQKGINTEYLIIAKCIMELSKITKENEQYFNKCLNFEIISEYTKRKINASLGNYFCNNKDYTKAITYYKNCNLIINEQVAIGCINSYIKNNRIKEAFDVLMVNYKQLESEDLLNIIDELIVYEKYHKQLSYVLLQNCNYIKNNDKYVKILYENIDDDMEVLLKLYNYFNNNELNNKILQLSMRKRIYNSKMEKVFARTYEYNSRQQVIQDYIYYITYEILKNDIDIYDSTLNILRKYLYEKEDYNYVRLAILKCYSKNKNYILNEQKFINESLKILEQQNLSLPCFKNLISKNIKSDYVYKYYTIQYVGNPKSELYIYIKYNDSSYKKVKMDYYEFCLFLFKVPVLYKDKVTYYFEEVKEKGSIISKKFNYINNKIEIINNDDMFFKLNNALIQRDMLQYNDLEKNLSDILFCSTIGGYNG